MLYVRFLGGAGGVLLVLMLIANAYLPQPGAPSSAQDSDHPTIRITSTRKGPERVVIDTSLPTVVPPPPSTAVADVAPPSPPAAREAFAQMPDDPSEHGGVTTAKPAAVEARQPPPRPTRRHVAARRSPEAPPMAPQARQFAGGFFPFWFR